MDEKKYKGSEAAGSDRKATSFQDVILQMSTGIETLLLNVLHVTASRCTPIICRHQVKLLTGVCPQ